MLKILRVENKNGEGPFVTNVIYRIGAYDKNRHPGPINDQGFDDDIVISMVKRSRPQLIFGFANQTQLDSWWSSEDIINLNINGGFYVEKYRVPRRYCHIGN